VSKSGFVHSPVGELQLAHASTIATLSADDVAHTARRLAITTAWVGALYLVYIVLYQTVWAAAANTIGMVSGAFGVAISIAATAYLWSGTRPTSHVALLAIAYEIALACVLSLSEAASATYSAPSSQAPWSAVLIVLFPFLIPAAPRVIFLGSVASAATGPLALVLMCLLGGRPWPDPSTAASFVLPPFLCALLAFAPTLALHRLRAAVQSARRLGNYELTEQLGQGGMGEVWRARHRLLARDTAVKLIKPEMLGAKDSAAQKQLLRRFEKEARATASLDSPHSVELYDFGVSAEGTLFYVMELLRGADLQSLVERFGPMPPERAVHLLLQACDSLDDAHARGLIHRDIKPANLFVARKGGSHDFLKVLDFGLVKRWRPEDDADRQQQLSTLAQGGSNPTALGQIVGTPAFLAPEAALGELALDGRADLYGLGCVAFFMLTGALVFEESNAFAMAVAHVTKTPPPLASKASQPVGPELERIVMQCLHKDREQRPRSAAELRASLAAVPCANPWTRERAAAWWQAHLPVGPGTPAPSPAG